MSVIGSIVVIRVWLENMLGFFDSDVLNSNKQFVWNVNVGVQMCVCVVLGLVGVLVCLVYVFVWLKQYVEVDVKYGQQQVEVVLDQ